MCAQWGERTWAARWMRCSHKILNCMHAVAVGNQQRHWSPPFHCTFAARKHFAKISCWPAMLPASLILLWVTELRLPCGVEEWRLEHSRHSGGATLLLPSRRERTRKPTSKSSRPYFAIPHDCGGC